MVAVKDSVGTFSEMKSKWVRNMFSICLKSHDQVYAALKTCSLNIAKFKAHEDVSSMKSLLNMFLIYLGQEFLNQVGKICFEEMKIIGTKDSILYCDTG